MLRTISFAGLALLFSACANGAFAGTTRSDPSGDAPSSPQIAVQPMTYVNVAAGTGYFQDPYPIHTNTSGHALTSRALPPGTLFSGTTQNLLSCLGEARICTVSSPIDLDPGALAQQASAAGSSIHNVENLNIYQDSRGAWQMAVTAHLSKPGMSDWNVILHAHPKRWAYGVPVSWVADALLVGDLGLSAPDNYDGKYVDDAGVLYLVYNAKVGTNQDGVVAQAMTSAAEPAASSPVPLLGPETSDGGYNSELADGLDQPNPVKLIETGNIAKIAGKYVMTYSVGTYNRPDYKSGIAWSDTFLPSAGTYYKRAQKIDTAGVWGQAGHAEVQYLLQSQIAQWPNYVISQVLAPGVPAIVKNDSGGYCLTFAGYDPSDAPTTTGGLYDGAHRRPYYVKLTVQIPPGATVAGTSAQDLVNWIQPATGP